MKDLMGKIKGFEYKAFFLRHGEKVGMGFTGLLVLICLVMTSWVGYAKTPQEMEEAAQKMETQLRTNVWPEAKQAEFVVLGAEQQVARLETPIELSPFDYLVPMSPKLYAYRMPADEPEVLPPLNVMVHSGVMAMALPAKMDEMTGEEEETPVKPAKPEKPRSNREKGGNRSGTLTMSPAMRGAGGPDDDNPSTNPMAAMMGMMGGGMYPGMGGGSMGGGAARSRGAWYNVVTAKVDRQKQIELLRAALHTDTAIEAAEFLEYYDFKIERQRAVPGPDPWTGPWVALNTKLSMDVLRDEAAYFEADLVPTENISQIFTSPLPGRLDIDWEFDEVGHPDLPKLDDYERELELAQSAAALLLAGNEADSNAPQGPGGFANLQRDANSIRSAASSIDGGAKMGEMMEKYMSNMGKRGPGGAGGPGGPGSGPGRMSGGPNSRGGAGAAGMNRMMPSGMSRPGSFPPGSMPSGSSYPGMGMSPMGGGMYPGMGGMYPGMGGAGMGGVGSQGPNLLLFRYFDFEVEPGECYRYRIQLVIRNPSHEETFVSTPEVANGETRSSKWSEPSSPAAVPKDIEYALVKVQKKAGRREGAALNVVQVDTAVGTLISDTLPLTYGQYVGGTKKSTHLNIAVPSLDEEDVTFNSKEILVDSIGGPVLSSTAIQELGLSGKQAQKYGDGSPLDQAITLNRFGELIPLDADSNGEIQPSIKRYKDQNEEYKDLQDSGASQPGLNPMDPYSDMMNSGKSKKKGSKLQNPMRMMMPGMMGMTQPGMSPEEGRGKKPANRRPGFGG